MKGGVVTAKGDDRHVPDPRERRERRQPVIDARAQHTQRDHAGRHDGGKRLVQVGGVLIVDAVHGDPGDRRSVAIEAVEVTDDGNRLVAQVQRPVRTAIRGHQNRRDCQGGVQIGFFHRTGAD